jgi:hypothetical protein
MSPLFDRASDWYRYAPNCWLVWTSGTVESWFNFLKPHINEQDYMLIVQIPFGSRFGGWLPKGAWAWFARERPEPHAPLE